MKFLRLVAVWPLILLAILNSHAEENKNFIELDHAQIREQDRLFFKNVEMVMKNINDRGLYSANNLIVFDRNLLFVESDVYREFAKEIGIEQNSNENFDNIFVKYFGSSDKEVIKSMLNDINDLKNKYILNLLAKTNNLDSFLNFSSGKIDPEFHLDDSKMLDLLKNQTKKNTFNFEKNSFILSPNSRVVVLNTQKREFNQKEYRKIRKFLAIGKNSRYSLIEPFCNSALACGLDNYSIGGKDDKEKRKKEEHQHRSGSDVDKKDIEYSENNREERNTTRSLLDYLGFGKGTTKGQREYENDRHEACVSGSRESCYM